MPNQEDQPGPSREVAHINSVCVNLIPRFTGEEADSVMKLQEYLDGVDNFSKTGNYAAAVVIMLAKTKLDGTAKEYVRDFGTDVLNSLVKFKAALQERFKDTRSYIDREQALSNIVQKPAECVDSYYQRVYRAGRALEIGEGLTIEWKHTQNTVVLVKFVTNLLPHLREQVERQNPKTLNEAFVSATKEERLYKKLHPLVATSSKTKIYSAQEDQTQLVQQVVSQVLASLGHLNVNQAEAKLNNGPTQGKAQNQSNKNNKGKINNTNNNNDKQEYDNQNKARDQQNNKTVQKGEHSQHRDYSNNKEQNYQQKGYVNNNAQYKQNMSSRESSYDRPRGNFRRDPSQERSQSRNSSYDRSSSYDKNRDRENRQNDYNKSYHHSQTNYPRHNNYSGNQQPDQHQSRARPETRSRNFSHRIKYDRDPTPHAMTEEEINYNLEELERLTCYRCRGRGHISSNCPSMRRINFKEIDNPTQQYSLVKRTNRSNEDDDAELLN